MATFTIQDDKTVRAYLGALARSIRAKFSATAYQGDYLDTVTETTLGDRLQVGNFATVGGVRYALVLNVLVARNAGGRVSIRVSAWSLSPATGLPVGTWPVRRTDLTGVRLTPRGFVRRIGSTDTPVDMAQRCATYLAQARANLASGHHGRPVVMVRTDRNGENAYDTSDSHLLPFGGYDALAARLAK